MTAMEVRQYQTAGGKTPVTKWLDGLRDGTARARITARLDRLKAGLFGDWKSVAAACANCGSTTGPVTGCITDRRAKCFSCSCAAATRVHKRRILNEPMRTGKTTKPAAPSRPFKAGEHLRNHGEVAAYIEAMLEDGDARAVPIALRTVVDALGGMTALADKTGLSRETLYRTLSKQGNPRLDTLATILAAFGLRLTVQPAKTRAGRAEVRTAHA